MERSNRPDFRQGFQKKVITDIFLGIDFGTSFTKVSYSYAPSSFSQIHTLTWNNQFFRPTILYIQKDRLFFEKPEGDCKEVKYFKYSILEKKLKNNRENTVHNFEEMCCVYFLSQIIKKSLKQILFELNIQELSSLNVNINMGVPLENFYESENLKNKGVYQEILENAVVLAGGSYIEATLPENQVLISNLDKIYSELSHKKAKLKWKVAVFPELAAEVLLYHHSEKIPSGVYAVVDIGGGTVDIALFQKILNENKSRELNCLGQKVLPYGVEILAQNDNLADMEKEFTNTFWEIFEKGKQFIGITYQNIEIFFLGGGSLVQDKLDWYRNALEKRNNKRITFKREIDSFITDEESIIEKNQRLLISQMLAKTIKKDDEVQSFPDIFKAELEERMMAPKIYYNYHDSLYDLLTEKYPK